MQVELRKSGDPTCEHCGSTELLAVGDLPLASDIQTILETEALRREVRLARAFRDAYEEIQRESDALLRKTISDADREREELIGELFALLASSKVSVEGFHPFQKRRERLFSERISAVIEALADLTRFPVRGIHEKDRS